MNGFIETLKDGASTLAMLASLSVSTPAPPPPEASLAEIQSLEHKVQQGDGPSVLPYLRKRLLRDHPELRAPNGQPKFIVGFLGEAGYSPEIIAKALQAFLPPSSDQSPKEKLYYNHMLAARAYRFYQEAYQDIQGSAGNETSDNTVIYGEHDYVTFTRGLSGSPEHIYFSTLSLRPDNCPSCSPNWNKDPRTCAVETVDQLREKHLRTVETAEHEAGHMLSLHLELRNVRNKTHPNNPEWKHRAEENFASTYGALRLIQIFGQEGTEYVRQGIMNSIQGLSHGYSSMWRAASLDNVVKYWEENPNLRNMPTKDIPALATRLMAPPSPEQIKSLDNIARNSKHTPENHLAPAFRKLANSNSSGTLVLEPDAEHQDRYYYWYASSIDYRLKTIAENLNKLNPQRPISFPTDHVFNPMTTPLTPQQRKDLERLNAPNRAPHCPAPKFD